ncbi:MAG: bifunctional phosphopantothenoylcysteine decarboxylase/phosphopantothenate--cysteine ligase CoaBC [Bradymonadia bacterium]
MLNNTRVHLCVAGGIAAYKAAEVARGLIKAGATVQVAMTPNARQFIGPLTFQGLTHQPVLTETLDPSEEMEIGHIAFAQQCDVLVVAPATANLIGKMANGLGDEIVSTVLLAANVPVVVCPAMNTFMYQQPPVQENLERLQARGVHIVTPDSGELACGHTGPGRLAEPDAIVQAVAEIVARDRRPKRLVGRRVVITAGPTREHVDPVRFLSNPSSGRTGFAIAAAAAEAGAEVILVHGPVSIEPPAGVTAVPVTSAVQMHAAVMAAHEAPVAAAIMTAAVADYRPAEAAPGKIKKKAGPMHLELVRNPDILADVGAMRRAGRGPEVLVGFAAETGHPVPSAQGKLARKGADLIVANDITAEGSGFAGQTNQTWFVTAEAVTQRALEQKTALAQAIVDWACARIGGEG